MYIELDCGILRNEAHKLVGFEVTAKPETHSEEFCQEFRKAIGNRQQTKADITVREGKLCFINPAGKCKECSIPIPGDVVQELSDLLEQQGDFKNKELTISNSPLSLTQGFRICVKTTPL